MFESENGANAERLTHLAKSTDTSLELGNDGLAQNNQEACRVQSNLSIAEKMSTGREIVFVTLVCSAQFFTQFGLGQCLSILHIIGNDFGLTNPGDFSWLIAGYSLTVGTFVIMAGRFGDLYGYKRMLVGGYIWFSIWSVIAGLSVYSSHVLFVFARVFQGIGPAFLLPNGLALLGVTYPAGKRKNMVFSIFGATAPVGSVIGSVMAGVFSLAWWPWVFWALGIALAILAIGGYYVFPNQPRSASKGTFSKKAEELDLLGGCVGITALVLINFSWNQAGVVGWPKVYVYVTLIIGVLLVPVFFWIEYRVAKTPLIPFKVMSVDVSFVLGCIVCGWGCFGIWVYYLWQFFEELRNASPLLASAWLCPVAIGGIAAAILTGKIIHIVGPSVAMAISMAAFLVGTILVATAPVNQTYWAQTFVGLLISPWGMDISFPAGTLIISNALEKKHQGIGASLVTTIVNYSISIGLGLAGTVEGQVNDEGRNLLKGYRGAFYVAIGLAGLGLGISLLFIYKVHFRR